MYLGMTEEDFKLVYNDTPKLVGKRIGVREEELERETLLGSIEQKDAIAFAIMNDFRDIYKRWWELSKKLPIDKEENNFYTLKRELETQIFKRDEIRKALVSYLNSKYGKANG